VGRQPRGAGLRRGYGTAGLGVRIAGGLTHIGPLATAYMTQIKRRIKDMEEGKEPAAEMPQEPARPGGRLPELNEARVIGRIVNPPKMKEGSGAYGDYKMARFVLAVNRSYKDSSGKWVRETDFVPVVAWGTIAETVAQAGKGSAFKIEGRIKTWQAEGKQYRWELKADLLEPLDFRPAAKEQPQKELMPS